MGKDLGRVGPRGFKSRSMQAWQQAYERGEATHSIAPFGYWELLKEGKISKKDVPYMVRGGSWDNSDVKGAKRLKWLQEGAICFNPWKWAWFQLDWRKANTRQEPKVVGPWIELET
jgi:hypothetical protein